MRAFSIPGLSPAASVVGLGTMIFHPDSKARDFEILDAFVAAGGTYIDTAEVYGAVEEHGYSEIRHTANGSPRAPACAIESCSLPKG